MNSHSIFVQTFNSKSWTPDQLLLCASRFISPVSIPGLGLWRVAPAKTFLMHLCARSSAPRGLRLQSQKYQPFFVWDFADSSFLFLVLFCFVSFRSRVSQMCWMRASLEAIMCSLAV
jgi:hypothetical protein